MQRTDKSKLQKKTLAPNVKCDMRVYNNNSNDFLIKISDNDRGQKAPDTVIETKVVWLNI